MEKSLRTKIVFHGAVVVLLGLVAGFPYTAVVTGALAGSERAWRMAHLEGVLNGLILLAVGGVWRSLLLEGKKKRIAALALIVAAYGNVVAAVIGAATGNRGLVFEAPLANLAVFTLFLVAVVAVFVGLGLVAWGARAGGGSARVHVEVTAAPSSEAAPASQAEDVGSGSSAGRASRRRSRRKR